MPETGLRAVLKWLTLSAKRGCRLALFFLGRRYLSGFLAPLDRKKGLDCLTESAEKGFPLAIYWAGLCCRLGVGTKKDDEMALHYLRLGADGGCQDALDLLNEMESENKSAH